MVSRTEPAGAADYPRTSDHASPSDHTSPGQSASRDSTVIVRHDGPVTTLELNRPESMNALNAVLVQDLGLALDEADRDRSCRVVILTGSGSAFCAGLDLNGYGDDGKTTPPDSVVTMFERQQEIAGLVQRVRRLRQPVIAAVNGAAAGGGLALVCAADIRMGSSASVFAVGFLRAGFSACDIGISWMLPRLLGVGRAHELMLTGRKFSADQAERYGLLTTVTAPADLAREASDTAQAVLAYPPVSVEMTKVGMWAAVQTGTYDATIDFENRQQMVTAVTRDRSEATAAFLDKRPPHYRGW
jgi:enoyl-CoA hydratase/carnithine racemase